MDAMTTINLPQGMTEDRLIDAWLATQRSMHTRRAYEADVRQFLAFCGCSLRDVSLVDVQRYELSLAALSFASIARRLSSVKSLLTFAFEWKLFPVDFGRYVKLPAIKNTLAERILDQSQVLTMLNLETNPRNAAIVRLGYNAGLRISELCSLCWRDLSASGDSGQITVMGKGGKTRHILLAASMWARLMALKPTDASPDAPVFASRQGGPLTPMQVHRIVKAAAKRAGLSDDVSFHWLRHAHVSHSLANGCDVNLVRTTVGHASLETTTRYCHARPGDSSARYLAA
jgi:integrase/recombinase XerD